MPAPPVGAALHQAHRAAAERLAAESTAAVKRAQAVMAATPGWQAAAKAAAAQSTMEAIAALCDALVAELLEVHLDQGRRDPDAVASYVDEHVLAPLKPPGLRFFEDSNPEATTLSPVALRHAAAFEEWRQRTVERLPAQFRQALEMRERRIPALDVPGPLARLRESRTVFAVLVVTALLSVCGVSWADVVRKVCALL
jgi:hypothetical protein